VTTKPVQLRKPVSLAEFFLQWEWILVLLLVLSSLLNAFLSPYFLNLRNIMDATFNFMEVSIMALPMIFVIITGGIDLSVASNLAMTSALMGRLYMGGMSIWVAAGIGLIFAGAAGLFNGLLITRVKLPPIAATLGTYVLYRGIAWILLTDGSATNLPANFTAIGQGYIPGTPIPIPLVLFAILVIPFGLLLHRTTFGRYTYAYGNNKDACRYAGVNTNRLLMVIFLLSGLMAGLAGILMAGRFASIRADVATGTELDVITAVVLGGVDINGGSGGIVGVILALFLLGELRYGMNLLNVPPQSQIIVTGFLLIVSIIVPQLVRRLTAQRAEAFPIAGVPAKQARPARNWLLVGGGAAIALMVVAFLASRCAAPGPNGGGPGVPGPVGAGTQVAVAATPTEFVLAPTNTPVPPPPTRTPRPTQPATATAAASPTSAPTLAAAGQVTATTAVTGASAGAAPTKTPIVMAMLPTPAPAIQPESDTVEIPAGPFNMGATDGNQNETPVHAVDLPAFLIDRFEVTNANFDAFTRATGYQTDLEKKGTGKNWRSYFTPDKADHPVVKVTFADATAYCTWAGKRLPSEPEWEKAARGTDGRTFPWGNLWDASLANVRLTGLRGTAAVGSFPGGASPYGVQDMAGNVGEWTSSPFVAYPGSAYQDPQYRQEARITRGGGWFDDAKQVRTSARNGAVQSTANDDLGFRCAADKK
jgi:rhamnose transport system permease protein